MKRFISISLLLFPVLCWAEPKPTRQEISGRELCKQSFDGYKAQLAAHPNDSAAWQELRVCADLLKRWTEAAAIAQAAIDNHVERPEPYFIVGLSHYAAKEYSEAADSYREAIRLNGSQAVYFFQLGLAYLHMNEPGQAVGAGVRATELDPHNSAYHRQLAFAYYLIKDNEKCEDEAKAALEIDRNDVAAYKILSNLYERMGRSQLAAHMAEEAIHANGRIAVANPFVPDKVVTPEELSPMPFQLATPPGHIEVFLRAQWEKMKQTALRGDVNGTAAYYSRVDNTHEIYRESLAKMGTQRMRDVFNRLGEISDCEMAVTQDQASCRCPVSGGKASLLETKVVFQKDPDNIWRIKSF
jgi:tetratricopeptide (TPR) repeat protein